MPRVDFYRLTRDPAARVTAMLAQRVLAGGDRLLVVGGDDALLAAISEALWAHHPTSFLAHGRADDPDAAQEPILLADGAGVPAGNGARMLVLADGLWRDAALGFARSFFLFDDRGVDAARDVWRALAKDDAVDAHFWLQDERGRWREATRSE